jgi:hypothetical protein
LRANEPFDVERFQAWMLETVAHRDGLEAGLTSAGARYDLPPTELESVIEPSEELTSRERLTIYSNMYFWRLVEVLEGDFAACTHVLGESAHEVWKDFIDRYPSRHYRLTPLGQHVAEFFGSRVDLADGRFLSDLARLEHLKEVVFEAKSSPVLEGGLQALAPEEWVQARLTPIAAFGLLKTDYPVNPYFQALIDDDSPELPGLELSFTLVWRQNNAVWRSSINRYQFAILTALRAGETLGDALQGCAELDDFDPNDMLPFIGEWFAEWTTDRVFAALSLS